MEAKWIDGKQVSQLTGIAVQTLGNWRQLRLGFPYIKIGRSIRYSVMDIEVLMQARRVETEAT